MNNSGHQIRSAGGPYCDLVLQKSSLRSLCMLPVPSRFCSLTVKYLRMRLISIPLTANNFEVDLNIYSSLCCVVITLNPVVHGKVILLFF